MIFLNTSRFAVTAVSPLFASDDDAKAASVVLISANSPSAFTLHHIFYCLVVTDWGFNLFTDQCLLLHADAENWCTVFPN